MPKTESIHHPASGAQATTGALVAADVYAVRKIGVEAWQREFWWPISDEEFMGLLDRVWGAFTAAHDGLDAEGRDLLLSDTAFITMLIQHLHLSLAATRCAESGVALRTGRLSAGILRPDWLTLGRTLDLNPDAGTRLRLRARQAIKRLHFNRAGGPARRAAGWLGLSRVWSLGSFSRLKAAYCVRHSLACDHPYIETLAPRPDGDDGPTPWRPRLEALAAELDGMLRAMDGGGLDAEAVACCHDRRLQALTRLYRQMACLRRPPRILLLSEVTRPQHKAAALGLRAAGTRVVGFHHGNDMANARQKSAGYNEYAHCTEFVCPTAKAAESHAAEYACSPASRNRPVSFTSVDTDYYAALARQGRRTPLPQHIRRMMVVGHPMTPYRYQYVPGDYFAFQLDVERRLIGCLTTEGHEVIYKAHPDRLAESRAVMEGSSAAILTERFETVWQQADAFLFGCTATTTFGFALCTNRPILVLDIAGQDWNPEAYALLKRRCAMIPAWFDERNRLQFDEAALRTALARPVTPPDMAYVETFMIPKPDGGRQA